MTIGIGALCSTLSQPHTPRPDSVVLLANTIGTDTDLTGNLQKSYLFPDERLFFVCVGRVELAADLVPLIRREFKQLKFRNHGAFVEALGKAVYSHRADHFRLNVLPSYYFVPGDPSGDQHRKVSEAWQRHDVGVHLLVATFDEQGQALLYVIAPMENTSGWVHRTPFPGVATIGLGAHAANFWLHYRRQTWACSVRQSAYHTYEAKRLATHASADVNMELIVATNRKTFHLTHDTPTSDGCPVSWSEMRPMFDKYGPQDTTALGHSHSNASPQSKPKRANASAR
jgi:hypothetical protein